MLYTVTSCVDVNDAIGIAVAYRSAHICHSDVNVNVNVNVDL